MTSKSKKGKKRIQPLLMSVESPPAKKTKGVTITNGGTATKKKTDTLENIMEAANKAAEGAEAVTAGATMKPAGTAKRTESTGNQSEASASKQGLGNNATNSGATTPVLPNHLIQLLSGASTPLSTSQIPFSTSRIHSVDLPIESNAFGTPDKFVADCTNTIQVPPSSRGGAIPCTTLTISQSGKVMWRDQLPGSSCSTIASSKDFLAVGTSDGTVLIFGTSPTLGWKSCSAFRSHPPFVFGRPIVSLQLHEKRSSPQTEKQTHLLVVVADGTFGVYELVPQLKVVFKGSIMPPMSHMLLSSDLSKDVHLPKLARIYLTETNKLFLLLSLQDAAASQAGNGNTASVGAGGSLQAFVYEQSTELWMRVSDSRFVLSDFYSTLPMTASKTSKVPTGILSKLDDSVRMGTISSSLKASRRGQSHADSLYAQSESNGGDVFTRSHCEDRMACALALESKSEFEYWLSMYARTLSMAGYEESLRVLVDMLLGDAAKSTTNTVSCWWLGNAPSVLNLDRKELIKTKVIPEMIKNRALQRLTNEIAIENGSLS